MGSQTGFFYSRDSGFSLSTVKHKLLFLECWKILLFYRLIPFRNIHNYKNALQRLDDEGKSFTCVVRLQKTRDKDEENKGAKRGTFVVRSKQTRDKDDGNKE